MHSDPTCIGGFYYNDIRMKVIFARTKGAIVQSEL